MVLNFSVQIIRKVPADLICGRKIRAECCTLQLTTRNVRGTILHELQCVEHKDKTHSTKFNS